MISEPSAAAELGGGLEVLATLAPEPAPGKAAILLARLTNDDAFLSERILPLLLRGAEGPDGWYAAHSSEVGSCSLEVFVWPPGTGTQIHDHTSWDVFIRGSVRVNV